jgi:hypothetical protein
MMALPRYAMWILLATILAAAWISAAIWCHDRAAPAWHDQVLVGFGFGTLCSVGTLCAAWTVLGPLSLVVRVPLAMVLQTGVLVSVSAVVGRGSFYLELVGLYGGLLLGQYLLAQVPLWAITIWRGVRLGSTAEQQGGPRPSDQQFGIREVMILTAAVAIVLGMGRWLIHSASFRASWPDSQLLLVIGFLVVANTTISLPLVFAMLLTRRALVASLLAAVSIALVTAIEVPAFELLRESGNRNDISLVLWTMNLTQALWVGAALLVLRLGGYRLMTKPRGVNA